MALPANIGFCTVMGRFIRATADGNDSDRNPDGIPVAGMTITFTAPFPVARNVTAVPPVTVFLDPVTASTSSSGALIGGDGAEGVLLVASNDPDLDPTDWTWTATITAPSIPRFSFSFIAPVGGVVDLTTVLPVPPNTGASVVEWQAAVSATMANVALAQTLVDGIPAAVDAAVTTENIPGKVATAIAAQAGKVVTGSGAPNGVVTAAVGTLYVDTAKTLGAAIWRKDSGAGNTGWVVVEGNTGLRNILEDTAGITSANAFIRRVGHAVTVVINGTTTDAGVATIIDFTTLQGFAPPAEAFTVAFGTTNTAYWAIPFGPPRLSTIGAMAGQRMAASIAWTTSDPWPTTLPGTAA